jgi:probable rRNA maturation factor
MSLQQIALLFKVATPGLSRRDLRAFGNRLVTDVTNGRAFCCLITSDAELRRLNRQFRKKDCITDVLSFPGGSSSGALGELGELAISFPRAKQQAADYGLSVEQEIQVLMLHGVLHLLGMDHETDRGRMARAEAKWRAALGLPRGLIERVTA